MKKSHYFSELIKSYNDEIDDLVTDSEGKSVLQKRLNDKRRAIDAILPMIEFSPEMVSVIFYGAFGFKSAEMMQHIVQSEPDRSDFPAWAELEPELTIAAWAETLINTTLKAQGGDDFLVTTAALEYLRSKGISSRAEYEKEPKEDDEGDEDDEDLSEAGNDWLAEQGFDTLKR